MHQHCEALQTGFMELVVAFKLQTHGDSLMAVLNLQDKSPQECTAMSQEAPSKKTAHSI